MAILSALQLHNRSVDEWRLMPLALEVRLSILEHSQRISGPLSIGHCTYRGLVEYGFVPLFRGDNLEAVVGRVSVRGRCSPLPGAANTSRHALLVPGGLPQPLSQSRLSQGKTFLVSDLTFIAG